MFRICLLILVLPTSQAAAEETTFFANIPIRGAISDEMAKFIAENSITTVALRTAGPLDDLVRETCGFVSPNNLKVFAEAVRAQGGSVDAEGLISVPAEQTEVPNCLPDEQEIRLVGRLPSRNDTLSQIFERDAQGGFYAARAQAGSAKEIWDTTELVALAPQSRSTILAELDHGVSLGGPNATLTGLAASTETFLRNAGIDPTDRSRLAYESFALIQDFERVGIDRSKAEGAVGLALIGIGSDVSEGVLRDAGAAIDGRQQLPQLDEIPLAQSFCQISPVVCDAEASGALIRLPDLPADVSTALNSRSRVRDIDTIYANVPILSAEPVARSATVELRSSSESVQSTDLINEVLASAGATLEESPTPPAATPLSLFLNVEDGEAAGSCSQGESSGWGSQAFQDSFLAAVRDAVAVKERLGEATNPTDILILDGGFFRFETEDFGGGDWARMVATAGHSDAASLIGMHPTQMEKVVHGTAVTSLALGGPGLMEYSNVTEMPITVRSMPIYNGYRRRESDSSQMSYKLMRNVAETIRDTNANIVNLSFGSIDDNDAYLRGIKETLFNPSAPLLVVAAGNLGNNDSNRGESVTDNQLKPQSWGSVAADVQNGGWNMIVVAAMDSNSEERRLAWFSNYGEDVVVLGAPGCKVLALRATLEGGYDTATFNGTSFAAPIVTFTASVLRTVMPRARQRAPWVRARLLASADLESSVARGDIRMGRVLNPVDALRIYEDIVTFRDPAGELMSVRGRIMEISGRTTLRMNGICESGFAEPHNVLRFYAMPDGTQGADRRWYIDLITAKDEFLSQRCNVRGSDPLVLETSDNRNLSIVLSDIEDIKFAIQRE